jgi:HEAT repeat protein
LPTDDVLPFLHDTDAEVRAVAEQALRSRGLQAGHLQLARQMTDPQPHVRARVPGLIQDFPDLDTRLWLERLSRDSSPAVRAAVVRAAGEDNQWQLAERMREMARGDPSATVRQIARYYLERQVYQNP